MVDLGVLSPGENREVAFSILNKGDRRLVINEQDSGCGCGEPVSETLLIPSGDTKEIVFDIDAQYGLGSIKKKRSFTTNDPAQPRFDLIVKARVDRVEPSTGSDSPKLAPLLIRDSNL